MKLLQERTALKLLIEKNGMLVCVTAKRRAYFLFLSPKYVGIRTTPTTDPDLGIVELSHYDLLSILRNWDTMANVRISRKRVEEALRARSRSGA